MAPVLLLFLLNILIIYGQVSEHCIDELKAVSSPIKLDLSDKNGISPNYSATSSVAYHMDTSTILVAGDYFYINPKNKSLRTYYSFFQAFSHDKNNKLTLKYNGYDTFSNPAHGKFIKNYLRSWTRIIAHPTESKFFVLGIENLTAYDVTNGKFLWTATIPSCSVKYRNDPNRRPLIYNDATFFNLEADNIYVAGSCQNDSNHSVVVVDRYNIQNGEFDKLFRLTYNLTELGFAFQLNTKFALIPPDVTIKAPLNETFIQTSVVKKYFYLGFTHLMFSGISRIEQDSVSGKYRIKNWPESFSLINPSFMTHGNIVTYDNGVIGLTDPNILNIISQLEKRNHHLLGWKTQKVAGQLSEKKVLNNNTWYGRHTKFNMHMDWTITIDPQSYSSVYVTSAPLDLIARHNSTIAKHDVATGKIIGGANVSFYALDTIVTNDGQLISVGFRLTPDFNGNISLEKLIEREAVLQIFNDTADLTTCVGCEAFQYGLDCSQACNCNFGYCNDDIYGSGECYCTLETYGPTCEVCNCLAGICHHGPDGTGNCTLCLEITLPDNGTGGGIGFSDQYGPMCDKDCRCNTEQGVCYSKGEDWQKTPMAGHCLYCTEKRFYGEDCNMTCDCDDSTQYCDNGPSGAGCVDYDYGGLLTNLGWQFYTPVGVALFLIFLAITWWQSNKQFKQQYGNDKVMPFWPNFEKDKKNMDIDNKKNINNVNKEKQHDLRQNLVNNNNNNDDYNDPIPNQPPPHSQVYYNDDNQQVPTKKGNKYDV